MGRFDFVGNFNLKVAAKSVDDVLKYVKARVSNINSRINVTYNRAQITRIERDFRQANREIEKTAKLTDDLASIFANATRRFAGVSIATATLLNLVRGIKGSYKEAIQFEREMVKVAQAQDTTIESTRGLSREISRLSVEFGTNALELAKTGRVLAQAGFNTKTTAKALEILSKINLAGTFGDTEENVEGMISILQQFGKTARESGTEADFLQEKFDIINKISKKYAVESSDIITAVSKAGGAFEASGGKLEEFIASITAVRSATRESAATIANGFKTIFTRLQRQETIESLRSLGVELVDAEGKFVGPIEALERLGRTLSVLEKGDVRFTQIAEEIGGIYQVNRLITLLKQQDVVQQALNDTKSASGDIDKDVAKALETTASKLDRLNTSFNDLVKTISETGTFRTIIDYLIKMAETAIMVAKALEPLTPLIAAGLGFQAANLGSKIFKRLAGFASDPKSVPTIAANNLATGGTVRGGNGGIDDVPAMLTRGEFVVNKRAAQENRGLLLALNSGQEVSMFSSGGSVGKGFNPSNISSDFQDMINATSDLFQRTQNYIEESSRAIKEQIDSIKIPEPDIRESYNNYENLAPDQQQKVNNTLSTFIGPMQKPEESKKTTAKNLSSEMLDYIEAQGSDVSLASKNPKVISTVGMASEPKSSGYDSNKDFIASDVAKSKASETKNFNTGLLSLLDEVLPQKKVAATIQKSTAEKELGLTALIDKSSTGDISGNLTAQEKALEKAIQKNINYVNFLADSGVDAAKKFQNIDVLLDKMESSVQKRTGNQSFQISNELRTKLGGSSRNLGSQSSYIGQDGQDTRPAMSTTTSSSMARTVVSGGQNVSSDINKVASLGQVAETSGSKVGEFFKKFGTLAIGAALAAESLQMFDKRVSIVAGSFAAGFTSTKLAFAAFGDALSSFAKMTKTSAATEALSEAATKASTAAKMQDISMSQKGAAKGGIGSKVGNMVTGGNGLSGVLTKFEMLGNAASIVVGLFSAMNAYQTQYIEALRKSNDEIINRVRNGKEESGDRAKFEKNLADLGDRRGRNDKLGQNVGIFGAIGTAVGAAVGSSLGSIVLPLIGTVGGGSVGASVGGIAGSFVGYGINELTGYTQSYIDSTVLAAEANYKVAKSSADFDRTLKTIKNNNIGAAAASKILEKEFDKAAADMRSAAQNTLKVDMLTSQSSGFLDYLGTSVGLFAPDAKSTNQKQIFEEAKAAEAAQKEVLQRAAEASSSAIKDSTLESINKAKTDEDLFKISSNLEAQAQKIKDAAVAASTETDLTKRDKEGDAAAAAFIKNNRKIIDVRSEEVQRINSTKIARELELAAIKRTTDSLISLAEQSNNLDIASALIDQVTTGSSKGVAGSRFSDITKIGNVDSFARDARSVASNLGPDGQGIATRAINGAEFISDLRSNLTSTLSADFDKLRASGLSQAGNANEIESILLKNSDAFGRLTKEQRSFAVNTIQSQIGKEGFDINTLDKSLNEIAGIFQKDADVLAKQADLANEQVEKIKSVNQLLIEAYLKQADLQIGLVDIQRNGQDRLNKVFDSILSGNDRARINDQRQAERLQRSNITLAASGAAPVAGNVNALQASLRGAQARLQRNNNAIQGESNIVNRTAILTENQRLNQAIKATTDELTRLANQSDRASDVMSEIEREQSKRSFIASKATDFITGSRQERAKMFEENAAMQNVLTSGTFQNLPDDLKKAALSGLEERAKLDTTGNIQALLNRAKVNDARLLGANQEQINALLNKPSTKEEMLINELRSINQEEMRAQMALIEAQNNNTRTMTDLLGKVNSLLGQPMQNVPIATPMNRGPINPIINGGRGVSTQQANQMNGGMQTVSENLKSMTAAISGMKVDHNVNINGQINVGGLNIKNIELELARGLEGFIVQKVKEVINQNNKTFRANR